MLVLGDSVVAGFEVLDHETFVALAERRLRKRYGAPIEVINAGVRGYGTDQSYLYYRDRGHALDADLVVFSHSANDLRNNVTLHRMRRPFGKGALRPDEQGELQLVGVPIPSYPTCSAFGLDDELEVVRTSTLASTTLCMLQVGLSDHSALFSFAVTRLSQHKGLIQWFNRQVVGDRGRPPRHVASVLPEARGGSVASEAVRARLTARIVGALADEVERRGASFLWLMSAREQEHLDRSWPELAGLRPVSLEGFTMVPADQLRFQNDAHYTAAGHQFFAELLTPEIEKQLLADRPDLAPPERRRRPARSLRRRG